MFNVGDKVLVFWSVNRSSYGSYYPATILKVNQKSYHISYDDWGQEWNQTVKKRYVKRSRVVNCDNNSSDGESDDEALDLEDEAISSLQIDSGNSSSSDSNDTGRDSTSEDHEESNQETETAVSPDGTIWCSKSGGAPVGRRPAHNIFTARPGLPGFVRDKATSELKTWSLLFTDDMLLKIRNATNEEAVNAGSGFKIELNDLKAFIGLVYLRGMFGQKHSVKFLFGKEFGPPIFRQTMSREKFEKIKRFLRFDIRSKRSSRLNNDKFCHIRDFFELFRQNITKTYVPKISLTIDEQLLPCESRCGFIQFMPSKPDKYGIKFWMLVEVDSKYVLNYLPYLGRKVNAPRATNLGQSVVMDLMEPFFGKGYNVTTDNFFTSLPLCHLLKLRKTSIVGTLRQNRREIPQELRKNIEIYNTEFYKDNEGVFLTKYQGKEKKFVLLLSTLHDSSNIEDTIKKKPETIQFYNKTKCGVDVVDSMTRLYSTKSANRRWPVAVWYGLLDIAALNAWILFKKNVSSSVSRKDFIANLSKQLISNLGNHSEDDCKPRFKQHRDVDAIQTH